MDLLGSNFSGLPSLCEKLRSERLIISHKQSVLSKFNCKMETGFNELHKRIWIYRHKQEILHQLINSDQSVSPENCCQLTNQLNHSTFVEAYKVLSHYAAEIVQLFRILALSPRAVAQFLNSAEAISNLGKSNKYSVDDLCASMFNVFYGSCTFPEDEQNMLQLLGHLIHIQLSQTPDPRKLLRKGNSTFSRMYKYFSETLPITKIFLTAALHDPIMFLLSQDELFLDIDPAKSPIRIPAAERRRRFGPDENSQSYKDKVAKHRRVILAKLVAITDKFVASIVSAMSVFPKGITWLVGQMHEALIERSVVGEEEAALICTDLIFTHFICSAVINPEPLGIVADTPISYIARFNLMQVGQMLQALAILPYQQQQFPAYFGEILAQLEDKHAIAIAKAMNGILQQQTQPASLHSSGLQKASDDKEDRVVVIKKRAFVGTLREINILQAYLKSSAIEDIDDTEARTNLKNVLKKLPEQFGEPVSSNEFPMDLPLAGKNANLGLQTPSSTSTRLKSLADRVQTVASRSHQRLMQSSSVATTNLRNLKQQRHLSSSASSSNVLALNTAESLSSDGLTTVNGRSERPGEEEASIGTTNQTVLMFAVAPEAEDHHPIGLASEEEIMKNEGEEASFNDDGDSPYFDPSNLTKCRAFMDAKRKLRLVLSSSTTTTSSSLLSADNFRGMVPQLNQPNGDERGQKNGEDCPISSSHAAAADGLAQMLKLLLAESINSQDPKRTALIREVQRCLSIFDMEGICTLLREMDREHGRRQAYIAYLEQSQLQLLEMDNCLERLGRRVERETRLTAECLVEMLVRFDLQKKDLFLRQFVHKFQQLKVQDEKIELVDSHLRHLCEQLLVEPMWRFASLENVEYARKCFERSLISHIYMFALFPNADADYYRDEVLSKSIQQLAASITVDHPELAIPKKLHAECPWPSAQEELAIMNAYKSPRDKMACITRCCETIQNLIVLSHGRTTAASADDILPVLVFVIIRANPPALLSNIQFIDGFYAQRMQGGEAYCWTQFTSAIEFLKTLLNKLLCGN